MIRDNQAGIHCSNCGHTVAVETAAESEALKNKLYWNEGDPECPKCSHRCWFEDYLD